jgi:hypothetical protein
VRRDTRSHSSSGRQDCSTGRRRRRKGCPPVRRGARRYTRTGRQRLGLRGGFRRRRKRGTSCTRRRCTRRRTRTLRARRTANSTLPCVRPHTSFTTRWPTTSTPRCARQHTRVVQPQVCALILVQAPPRCDECVRASKILSQTSMRLADFGWSPYHAPRNPSPHMSPYALSYVLPAGTPSNRGAIHPSQVGLTAVRTPVHAPPARDPRSNAMQPLRGLGAVEPDVRHERAAAQPPRYQGTLYENQRGGSPKNQTSQNAPPPPPLIHMTPPCGPRAGCEGQNNSRFSTMMVPAPAHAMQAGSYTPQKGVAKQPVSEWGMAAKLANTPALQVVAPVHGQKSQISIRPAGPAREVTRCDLCAAQMTGSACVKTSCGHQYHQRCLESYVKQLMDRNVHKLRCPACMVPLNVILSSENPVPLLLNHDQVASKLDLGHHSHELSGLLSPNSMQYSAPQANRSILPMDYKTVSPKPVSAFHFQAPY